jgi:imidazolonepropionase-like amidohydrolase
MVRAMAGRGVDRIKVLSTERAALPDTDPRIRIFSDDELAAIVDEAQKAGLNVITHAHGMKVLLPWFAPGSTPSSMAPTSARIPFG